MQDEGLFSHDGESPTSSDVKSGDNSERSPLTSAPTASQTASTPAHVPETEQWRTTRQHQRLLLLALVVVLVVLIGGYAFPLVDAPGIHPCNTIFLLQTPLLLSVREAAEAPRVTHVRTMQLPGSSLPRHPST